MSLAPRSEAPGGGGTDRAGPDVLSRSDSTQNWHLSESLNEWIIAFSSGERAPFRGERLTDPRAFFLMVRAAGVRAARRSSGHLPSTWCWSPTRRCSHHVCHFRLPRFKSRCPINTAARGLSGQPRSNTATWTGPWHPKSELERLPRPWTRPCPPCPRDTSAFSLLSVRLECVCVRVCACVCT